MSKKYRYIRLENISNFEGWDLVEIIPAKDKECYNMCVMCYDDAPSQQELEIEKLHEALGRVEEERLKERAEYMESFIRWQNEKNEAMKDFAEIIIGAYPDAECFINCLLKEMAEVSNGEYT